MSEGGGEVVDGLVESTTETDVGEVEWEAVHGLVEPGAEGEVLEGVGEFIYRLIESSIGNVKRDCGILSFP